jgi:hypothetical protein
MDNACYPAILAGCNIIAPCRENSFFVPFTDEDIDCLLQFAFDMGYSLEPVKQSEDNDFPMRFKITSKANPLLYGWIAKVIQLSNDHWEEALLYGFYRHGNFIVKYPITFNIESTQVRRKMKRKAADNPHQEVYFRTMYGILDLEPETNPLDFIFSWLYACNIKRL